MNKTSRDCAPDSPEAQEEFDRENVFLLYANFCGDVERTAHSAGRTPIQVLELAQRFNWNERLSAIIKLKKSTKPGDLERGLNRAMNFVQAQRMRLFIGRLIRKFSLMDEEELNKYCFTTVSRKEKGSEDVILEEKMNMKAFSDLAAAMEKCHTMSYLALNDTASERVKRGEEADREVSATEVHQAIADAMAKVASVTGPGAELADEQIRQGQEQLRQKEQQKQLQQQLQAELKA